MWSTVPTPLQPVWFWTLGAASGHRLQTCRGVVEVLNPGLEGSETRLPSVLPVRMDIWLLLASSTEPLYFGVSLPLTMEAENAGSSQSPPPSLLLQKAQPHGAVRPSSPRADSSRPGAPGCSRFPWLHTRGHPRHGPSPGSSSTPTMFHSLEHGHSL